MRTALICLCAVLGCAQAFARVPAAAQSVPVAPTPAPGHALWSLPGRTNTVYLLGSVHFLPPSEQLPDAIEAAYTDAEALVMEIDMDDLDPAQIQQAMLELGMLPPGQSLRQLLGEAVYAQVAARANKLGLDPALLEHFRPWMAAMTLVQLHMMKMGLDPLAGVEQRLSARAQRDGKPIEGLETIDQQLGLLAKLPPQQQHEFLMYSVQDSERMSREIDELLAAWRQGDTDTLERLLAAGFEQYPDLYRPLTVERNRNWIGRIEALLNERDDYLVVVGALHLVGQDSVVELLRNKGHQVSRH